MSERTLRFLSASDVVQALPMSEAIEAMKHAFRLLAAGQVVMPPRTHIEAAEPPGDALVMPSYVPADEAMGIKVVTVYRGNRASGLPVIQALMLVLDAATGSPVAVMDGTSLTAIRTGAASGAATDLLANPDASTVAIFGSGPQARTQLEAVCTVRSIRRARVLDPDAARAAAFALEMAERLGVPIEPVPSSANALAEADIVCTATTSTVPVFADAELAPGAHINAIGSYKPAVREIPGETVRRARVVVDHRPAALAEAGDLLIPMVEGLIGREHIWAELGEILAGTRPGRQSPGQVTLFKSVGLAVQDLCAARRVLANARLRGLGSSLPL
ncbi:MAG TPA: ornithine cyclodeaminase family protein [Planctomycetota bacterium]|nr:ornithine cyclodeaminase family protein [Planctomycetota bacterium]